MKLKITFSQLPVTGTTLSGKVFLPVTNINQTYSVTYNLTKDCNTTSKFIDLCKETFQTGTSICRYNFYKNVEAVDIENYYAMKHRMNTVIETINAMDELPNIDTSLMLDVSMVKPENSKLNTLHLYFELTSKDFLNLSEESHLLLEEINQLVHTLEGNHKVATIKSFAGIMRLAKNDQPDGNYTLPLTDEDYGNFTQDFVWGDLLLDYYRVGKDLFDAAVTNDVALVTTRGLCQQNTVHTAINVMFPRYRQDAMTWKYDRDWYDKWCDENNVRDYYDIDLPMFNLGRVVLGKVDMTGTTEKEIWDECSRCTSVVNIELIDE